MTSVEWDLIKKSLEDLAKGQRDVSDSIVNLNRCVGEAKESVKDVRDSVEDIHQMIVNMVPNGDIFQHRFDHAEINDTRSLKKAGKVKIVEFTAGAIAAVIITSISFYFKFSESKELEPGPVKPVESISSARVDLPKPKNLTK